MYDGSQHTMGSDMKGSNEPLPETISSPSPSPPVSPTVLVNNLQKEAASKQGTHCGIPKRLVLVVLSCLGLTISYADRSNIAIAIIPMSKEFGWDPAIEGAIFSCFFYGYMATQILGGYLSDRLGGKYIFGAGALGWSIFTLITPFAARWHFIALIVCRVCLGIAEGVSYPAINSLLGKWLPIGERSRATAAVNSFSYAGAVMALLISAPMAASDRIGWPWVFYVFGGVGIIWMIPWILMIKSRPPVPLPPDSSVPSKHNLEMHTIPPDPALNGSPTAEQQHEANEDDGPIKPPKKRPVPWKKIIRNKYTWAILVNQYCNCWGFFVLLQWLPSYYRQEFGVDLKDLGLVSIVPYCVQFSVGLIVGFVADWMVYRLKVPLVWIRKGSQTIALLGAAFFMLMAGFVASNIVQGVVFITLALGINSLSNVGLSVAHFDINPEFAGVIFGLGNTAATLTGIVGVQVTGLILQWTGSWPLVFLAAAFHYVVGVIVWLAFAHPDRKLVLTP